MVCLRCVVVQVYSSYSEEPHLLAHGAEVQ